MLAHREVSEVGDSAEVVLERQRFRDDESGWANAVKIPTTLRPRKLAFLLDEGTDDD